MLSGMKGRTVSASNFPCRVLILTPVAGSITEGHEHMDSVVRELLIAGPAVSLCSMSRAG
jgi:hypothetical protein